MGKALPFRQPLDRFRWRIRPQSYPLIRGAKRFAPWCLRLDRVLGSKSAMVSLLSSTSPHPGLPFAADDAYEVGGVLSALVAPLLDRQQPVALGQAQCGLGQAPADARSGGNGVDAEAAHAFGGDLVSNDAQDRPLPLREARSELWGQGARAGQQPTPVP